VEGLPLPRVWPPSAELEIVCGLDRTHVTGAHRTLRQDLAFAIDQLVEIAIRALSPSPGTPDASTSTPRGTFA